MPIPWVHIALTVVGLALCFVPGVVLYFMLIRKANRFQNLVVTTTPANGGAEVSITHPPHAGKLVEKFLAALPQVETKTPA
jgi:hypothetical protein